MGHEWVLSHPLKVLTATDVLGGLVSQPELNGQDVAVLGREEDGRVPVRIIASGRSIKVRLASVHELPPGRAEVTAQVALM